jgi:hypothetical protein
LIDDDGAVYITGTGKITLPYPYNYDIHWAFLKKLIPDNDMGWTQKWGYVSHSPECVSANVNVSAFGNINLSGSLHGYLPGLWVDLDPGPETDMHPAPSFYISKFDQYVTFIWARSWQCQETETATAPYIASDDFDNIYLAGQFQETMDFDPGDGVEEHTSNGQFDAFLCKLNSDGEFLWVCTWGGPDSEGADGILVDNLGNIFVLGNYQGTVDFDPNNGGWEQTSNGGEDIFLSKFDNDGNFQWVRTWGGSNDDAAYTIKANDSGDIYVAGYFRGSIDFYPGPGADIRTPEWYHDYFVSSFNNGGDFIKVVVPKIGAYVSIEDIDIHSPDYFLLTGCFGLTVDFYPGPGFDMRTSNGGNDVFLIKIPSHEEW